MEGKIMIHEGLNIDISNLLQTSWIFSHNIILRAKADVYAFTVKQLHISRTWVWNALIYLLEDDKSGGNRQNL